MNRDGNTNELEDRRYIQSAFAPVEYPDIPGTMATQERMIYPDAISEEPGLIDVSDIGIGGPVAGLRALGSSFARGMIHPMSRAGRNIGMEAQTILNNNPNLMNNALYSTEATARKYIPDQIAQDVAESTGREIVPRKVVSGTVEDMSSDQFANTLKKALDNPPPKQRQHINFEEYKASPEDMKYETENLIDKYEALGRLPYKNPKTKEQMAINREVQNRIDAEAERIMNMPDNQLSSDDFAKMLKNQFGEL